MTQKLKLLRERNVNNFDDTWVRTLLPTRPAAAHTSCEPLIVRAGAGRRTVTPTLTGSFSGPPLSQI